MATTLAWSPRLAGLAGGMIDVHTHAIDPDLLDLSTTYGGSVPAVERTGSHTALIRVHGRVYREVDDRCWSTSARLRDMDAEGVGVQVLSPIPVTLCHGESADGVTALAHAQNSFLAALVDQAPQRFLALGAVPMQDPARAVAELTRCMTELGFLGVEIGTRVGELELADPRLWPFFDAASELGAVILIHPFDGALDQRLAKLGLGFGLGMPTETAVAAALLLAAGTVQAAPGARFVLAHGGGALPALLPRLERGQLLAGAELGPDRLMSALARRLFCDSLTYDLASLELAVARFGASHVVMGTDYPFLARERPSGAILAGLDSALRDGIARSNACALCRGIKAAAAAGRAHGGQRGNKTLPHPQAETGS